MKLSKLKGIVDLETNSRIYEDAALRKDHVTLEHVVDSQTKRLNDHYSVIAGLRAECRRLRSELRQLTRTVEALSASHGRQSNTIGFLVRKVVLPEGPEDMVATKRGTKK